MELKQLFFWQDTQICDTNLATIDGRAVDSAEGAVREAVMRSVRQAGTLREASARKDRTVHVRLSGDEHSEIAQAASQAGMTVSAFLRSLALDGAGVLPFFSDPDIAILELIHGELRAIGVDLNGLVRAANRGELALDEAVHGVVFDLRGALVAISAELSRFSARGGRKRQGRS